MNKDNPLTVLREALDFLADDSLETTIEQILANREWSEKQQVSAVFVRALDALDDMKRLVEELREIRRLCAEGHGDDLIAVTADAALALFDVTESVPS